MAEPAAHGTAGQPMARPASAGNRAIESEDVSASSPADGSGPFTLRRTISVEEAKLETHALPTDVVVKVHGTGVRPSYLQPWQVKGQRSWTGTGFFVAGRRIMTNAHVVEDATVLQVTKQENPQKFRARVACVAHDIDLAIVVVDDERFWEGLPHASFEDVIPELYSEVKAVGFPTGGATVCVTKGIVSRIDAQVYVHPRILGVEANSRNSPGSVIVLQIDAAINPGNSGGPTFDKHGRVVGIASSGLPSQQNVGYIIPSSIAQMFVDEFDATGKWSGISEIGIEVVALESDSMRRYLRMGDSKGVLVSDVATLGALHSHVREGDVVTHVDGKDVTNEGDIPFVAAGQKIFLAVDALVTQKPKGGSTTFRILREGKTMEVVAALAPIPPLAPRFHGYDCSPDFVLIGGIVFTRGTVPLKKEYLAARKAGYPFIADSEVWDYFDAYKESDDHEIVVLLTILKHDVNLGYGHEHVGVLKSFNDHEVRSLTSLARYYGEAMSASADAEANEFLRFCMAEKGERRRSGGQPRPDIVLERSKVAAADLEICATNHIRDVGSERMLPFLRPPPPPPSVGDGNPETKDER